MKSYKVIIPSRALKYINSLVPAIREAIFSAIDALESGYWDTLDLKPMNPKKENRYRVRVGKYRIIFRLVDGEIYIYVLKIGPRGDVYK